VKVRRLAVIAAVVLAAGLAGCPSRVSDSSFRNLCVRSAHNALDGLDMARRATQEGATPFEGSLLDRAHERITTAHTTVANAVPPDQMSAQRRTALLPLLTHAENGYQDLVHGGNSSSVAQAHAAERELRHYIARNST
jgi:hypothetical protein